MVTAKPAMSSDGTIDGEARVLHRRGKADVPQEFGAIGVEPDVRRLQVAVDHRVVVGVDQRLTDLDADA
jgi:hypothetical protein